MSESPKSDAVVPVSGTVAMSPLSKKVTLRGLPLSVKVVVSGAPSASTPTWDVSLSTDSWSGRSRRKETALEPPRRAAHIESHFTRESEPPRIVM